MLKLSDQILPSPGFGVDEDMRRIIDIPMVCGVSPEVHQQIEETILNAEARANGEELLYDQACAINEYLMAKGGFFPIGVGFGKTGISLILSNLAFTRQFNPLKRILLVVPPRLEKQLLGPDLKFWRYMTPIQYQVHAIIGKSAKMRKTIANSGRPGLYVMAYSQIGNKDGEHLIASIDPELIILDEAHNINSKKHSTRSSRVIKYLNSKPNVELVAMSGTFTSKSILEYRALAKHALKNYSFLPHIVNRCVEWSQVLDAEATKEGDYDRSESSISTIKPLIDWYRSVNHADIDNSVASARRAYQYRMACTPGCHTTGDRSIPTSITMCNTEYSYQDFKDYPNFSKIVELADKVENFMETPTGERIDFAIHKWKWLWELWGGFYNRRYWPQPEVFAKNNRISVGQAQDLLSRAQHQEQLHRVYLSELRKYLSNRALKGADSPSLVGGEFSRHGVNGILRNEGELYDLWLQSKNAEFKGMPKQYQEHVRVCDYKVTMAVEWGQKVLESGEGGVIWFHHHAMGQWIREYLRSYGIPHKFYASWSMHPDMISDESLNKNCLIVASYDSFGTGINLQFLTKQLFLQFPRPAKEVEQVIGRLHRTNQKADEIEVDLLNISLWDHINFAATLNDSLYIHQSLNTRQKLIYANYDPLPIIFPPHVLNAQGAEADELSKQEQEMLQTKFGKYEDLDKLKTLFTI